MNPEWKSRYDLGVLAAQAAGKIALGYFDTGVAVETKPDRSPVTIADRSAEQALRKELLKHFPNDGFLGEEFGDSPGTSGYRWIIDPIDGTRSFIRNIPIWATLVGLEYRGEMIAGITYIPAWDQTFRALRGDGTYRDARRIRVSDVAVLDKALLSYSSFGFFKAVGRQETFTDLLAATERSRSYADFYGFLLVAQGSVDLMADYGVHIWDVAGLKVIVEEAGGKFTDWDGQPTIDRPDILASNGKLHAATLAILQSESS
ncbi:MAG: histidinol phosphate phosphatase [Planctomycetes bacterium]|nr:histidinol phosphate phosphatase [Planctomycetota bacterium]